MIPLALTAAWIKEIEIIEIIESHRQQDIESVVSRILSGNLSHKTVDNFSSAVQKSIFRAAQIL